MIRAAATRVQESTDPAINEEIQQEMEQRISYYAAHPAEISNRLWELDHESDTERMLEAISAGVSLFGMFMGVLRSRRWLLLSATSMGFLMQHAANGWCPPLPIIRRLGVRTRTEIEQERYALKVLRGDFQLSDLEGKSDLERVASILTSILRR